jgi:hypothetical protein
MHKKEAKKKVFGTLITYHNLNAAMLKIEKKLEKGHNEQLANEWQSLSRRKDHIVKQYTKEMKSLYL